MSMIPGSLQTSLHKARERFSEGAPLPTDLIPVELANSWERSRQAGLTPHSRRLECATPLRQLKLQTQEANQQLISHVKPEMELLWQSLMNPQWTLLCINQAGLIVHDSNAASATAPELKTLITGRTLGEMEVGTTAPSCVLKEARPFTLSASQHYLCELDRFFCAALPIRSPDGQLLAAIDITGVDMQPPLWLQERLNFTAISIENHLYLDLPDCSLLHFHADPRLIGTPLEGIIAFDPDGYLLHANRSARIQLGLNPDEYSTLTISMETLLGSRGRRSIDKLRLFPDETHQLCLASGRSLYARLHRPEGYARTTHKSVKADVLPPAQIDVQFDDVALDKSFSMAKRVFAGEVPILIQGETGTGKEVFAKALHQSLSPDRPFIAINCSAIPASLIEAELFGYSDGAFTGGRKGGAVGKLEMANGGTLFLDEIGDMPLDLQTRLLRVLQERNVTRLGDHRETPLNVRLISASHRDIEELIQYKEFREDLFYRINGLRIILPPVRARTNIVGLIGRLLEQLSPNVPKTISPEVLGDLIAYGWPGNVRELQQALKIACIFSGEDAEISRENFPPDIQAKLASQGDIAAPKCSPLRRQEKETIRDALARNGGNISATASQLGLSRSTLYKKMRG